MAAANTVIRLLKSLWPSKIRYQLILGVAAVHLTLMTLFVFDLVERQRDFLLNQSLEETRSLVQTLAINSSSWVLANDVVGLGELINAMQRHVELRYAMVIDQDGKVMAHTDRSKVGLYVKDTRSISLLNAQPQVMTLHSDHALLDVAAPIFSSTGKCVGWARIGHGRESIARSLSIVSKNGILYTLLAILVGSVFATLIGYRLTSGLNRLLSVSGQIRNGQRDLRMDITRDDEISRLGRGLNQMLDSMVVTENEIQDLYNNAPCGYHSLDKDATFVRINNTELKWLGYTREEMVGKMRFTDMVTPKGIETFREHFPLFTKQGQMHDLEYEMVRKDGTIMPVLLSATAIYDHDGNYLMSRGTVYDMTDRNQAEQKIAYLAAIVESSDDAIIGKTLDGIVTSWNKGAERIYGYNEYEIVGKPITTLVPPEREDDMPQILRKTAMGEHIEHYETVRRRKDGQYIDMALTISPIRDAEGRIVAASTIGRDITEKKRNERKLKLAGIYNRTLIEASLDPLVTIDAGGKITDVNSATESVTGYGREKLIATDFSDYFTEPNKAREGYQQVFREGTVRDYALEIRHRDGHVIPVLYNASVYRNEAGDVIGVFAAARDITERKRSEETLRKGEARLKEAQRIAHLGNWELDLKTNALYWSDEVYRIFGLEPQEFGATYDAFLEHVYPDDRGFVNKAYTDSVRNRTGCDIEHRLLLKSGEVKYVNERCDTEYDDKGNPRRSIGTVLDITERRRMEEDLRKINDELEQRVKERTAELEAKNEELQKMNRLFVDRELRMIELKERIIELEESDDRGV